MVERTSGKLLQFFWLGCWLNPIGVQRNEPAVHTGTVADRIVVSEGIWMIVFRTVSGPDPDEIWTSLDSRQSGAAFRAELMVTSPDSWVQLWVH